MRSATTRRLLLPALALLATLALALGAPAAVHADGDLPPAYRVGDVPEDVEVEHWVNPPAWPVFSDYRGDVVIFKRWGFSCGPCLAQIKRLAELDREYRDKGLHVIGEYEQLQSWPLIKKHLDTYRVEFPVAMDGTFGQRFRARLLCNIWVIGVDGRIIHSGVNGWEEAALRELKKVRYPRLGRRDVAEPLVPAATAFGAQNYGRALQLAEQVAGSSDDDAVVEQAEWIAGRVLDMAEQLKARAWSSEVLERYDMALAALRELGDHYADVPDVPDAAAEILRIGNLETFDAVTAARTAFVAARLEVMALFQFVGADEEKQLKATAEATTILRGFIEAHPGCAVTATARDMLASYEQWNGILRERLDPPSDNDDEPGDGDE